jgi:hypothetical protein
MVRTCMRQRAAHVRMQLRHPHVARAQLPQAPRFRQQLGGQLRQPCRALASDGGRPVGGCRAAAPVDPGVQQQLAVERLQQGQRLQRAACACREPRGGEVVVGALLSHGKPQSLPATLFRQATALSYFIWAHGRWWARGRNICGRPGRKS